MEGACEKRVGTGDGADGALDGPLRGSARLGKAAFEWVKGINLS